MPLNVLALPAEALCAIFVELSIQNPAQHGYLGWISMSTHVCQKWRRTALGFPQLWADNICALASDAATDCFLQRAQSALLLFCPRYTEDYSFYKRSLTSHQLSLAEKHLSRARKFTHPMHNDAPLPLSFVEALQTNTLPHMTVLHLNRWRSMKRGHFAVPFTLNAPVLRELRLKSVFLTALDTPQLRLFQVESTGKLKGVPAATIYAALRGMPLLEVLTLVHTVAHSSKKELKSVQDSAGVSLPHLRHLYLREEVHDFAFCRGLHAPAAADVSITSTCLASETATTLPFAILLAATEHHMRTPSYDTLVAYEQEVHNVLHWSVHRRIHLRSSTSTREYDDDGVDEAQERSNEQREFRLDAEFGPAMLDFETSLPEIIELMLPHIAPDRIRVLDLGGIGDGYGAEKIRPLLAPFVNVAAAQLYGKAVLQGALIPQSDNTIHLPALKLLVIEGFSADVRTPAELEEAWAAVTAMLDKRKLAGHAIRFLALSDAKTLHQDEKFPSAQNNVQELEACDARCMLRAKESVEEVYDIRGMPSRDGLGKITEFLKALVTA